MSQIKQRVVVLGASDQPYRYSHKAVQQLLQHGHEVVPVNPNVVEVEGLAVLDSLDQVEGPVDTLTLYVSPRISRLLIDKIIQLKPGRVIFNPGSENRELQAALQQHGIAFEEACTLVLLRTGQF
jgi:predicted CoA-binding protein